MGIDGGREVITSDKKCSGIIALLAQRIARFVVTPRWQLRDGELGKHVEGSSRSTYFLKRSSFDESPLEPWHGQNPTL